MIVNLHAHTYRCGHASGTEREYIERALQNGIKVFGFSDHTPFIFPNGYESNYRVPMNSVKEYIETLSALKEEYKDRIDIKIGFEFEYYPLYFKDMFKVVKDAGAEYLILGEHFLRNELPERKHAYTMSKVVTDEDLCDYVGDTCEGMATCVFTYLAHPDLINYNGNEELYLFEMNKICKASNKYGVPLELNFLGIRDNRVYPRNSFWEMVGKEGCEVVYGFDAHSAHSAYDESSISIAEEMRKKYGLRVNEAPKIVNIQNINI